MSFPVSPDPYVLVTDRNLNVVGDPIAMIQSLTVTQNFNVPDSGSLVVPAIPDYMSSFHRGNRLVVIRDGEVFSAGPIERPGGYEWGVGGDDASSEEEPGLITVDFTDDSVHPASRRVYPNPTLAADAQTTAYYNASGNAETLMRNLVNLNAGPGALVARRTPRLIMGAVAGVGSNVVVKSRFDPLGDILRTLASSGGGLGFRVVQIEKDLVFQVYAPRDRSKIARFSRGIGNLRSVKYDIEAPTGTVAIVGGSGEETSRKIVVRNNSVAEANWWRTELFVEGSQSDDGTGSDTSGGMAQAGDDALAQNGEQVKLVTVTIDTEDVKYGRDYGLGDTATVEVFPGVEVKDTVRSANYSYTPSDGESVSVLIGSQEATRDPSWIRTIESMSARLGQLERK